MYLRGKRLNLKFDESDYSKIFGDSIVGNPKIIDVAMLGAHDAFSNAIHFGSHRDPQVLEETPILKNDLAHNIAKIYSIRMVKAQYSYADVLLKKGVRYFDVRLSAYKDAWYTKHGLISEELKVYLLQIIEFLTKNPTEFIIFDIQHCYVGDKSFDELTDYIEGVKYEGKCLFDFVHYNPKETPIHELDYYTVTCGREKGGVVMTMKCPLTEKTRYHYPYEENVRSHWHMTYNFETLKKGIEKEYQLLSSTDTHSKKIRINQSQLTGILPGAANLLKIPFLPSLLTMAEYSNGRLVDEENFERNLAVLPIYMVDFANSVDNDFNNKANKKIMAFNKTLK